jgi:nicotinamide-nucleotide amidase
MAEELAALVPDEVDRLAEAVLRRACDRNLRIVTAESCTGGLLASLLTDIEGASHAFERGFVSYSDAAKCELLGVERDRLDACGAVSRQTAEAMVRGALRYSHGDLAVAITGFAGPGAPGDEAGLVHFACGGRDGAVMHREEHFGDVGRGPVRLAALRVALEMLDAALAR